MNTLLFRLLFTIILGLLGLTGAWSATVANAAAAEQAVEVNGVLVVKIRDTVSLRTGQRYKVGEKCDTDTVNVSVFTARKTCKWDAIVKATASGLEELPGGVSTESVPRVRKIFAALMVLLSMLTLLTLLAPLQMSVALCAAFVSVVSLLGMIFAGVFGSWLLSAAMAVSLISGLYVTAAANWPDTYDHPLPYTYTAKAAIIAAWLVIFATI